eukprot:CAMPEP_0174694178 /NCGR_PEP_ID=MMETSP1094-20130205/807_1 /TAXON_ID=156173 /ORGANISM="Chrysochromulina brevifilum, Strain UTEX LB 985" /LENGTH=46 /DNA_ID= /DNA_START= /DNA_END= /DNA_ORIENTATION=
MTVVVGQFQSLEFRTLPNVMPMILLRSQGRVLSSVAAMDSPLMAVD